MFLAATSGIMDGRCRKDPGRFAAGLADIGYRAPEPGGEEDDAASLMMGPRGFA